MELLEPPALLTVMTTLWEPIVRPLTLKAPPEAETALPPSTL